MEKKPCFNFLVGQAHVQPTLPFSFLQLKIYLSPYPTYKPLLWVFLLSLFNFSATHIKQMQTTLASDMFIKLHTATVALEH